MGQRVSQQLLRLSHLDGKIFELSNKKAELEAKRQGFVTAISAGRERLASWEQAHKDGRLKQVVEEHRVRDEHEKIVERRKQLTAIGGARVGKLMEREIDIASRTLQLMEERAMKALEEVDAIETQLAEMRVELEKLETQFEGENQQIETVLGEITGELTGYSKEREQAASALDDRMLRLYSRVKTRYPSDAVSVADSGACRSCFRALPAQTYNQILAGNIYIQCPGCSRILIQGDS